MTSLELIEEALHLPRADRAHLASKLLESLDEDDHEMSDEWLVEIRRRVQEMKSGTTKMIPHEEVMSNVRARLAKNVRRVPPKPHDSNLERRSRRGILVRFCLLRRSRRRTWRPFCHNNPSHPR
ncbi:MAG: addiction module protein [Akkermansiaceae bacterium]|nr:addiction module protein [Akkermansiaceae bacterium]